MMRTGWRGNPYGHALAARGIRTKPKNYNSTYKVNYDRLMFRRRGKVYELDVKSDPSEPEKLKREVQRIRRMSLAEIKKRYALEES